MWGLMNCTNNIIFEGVVAGFISALVQLLIFHLQCKFSTKNRKIENGFRYYNLEKDQINELVRNVANLKVPIQKQGNENDVYNAYSLIFAYFQISKANLLDEIEIISIDNFFRNLRYRYTQMQEMQLENVDETRFDKCKNAVIIEIEVCKSKLLKLLRKKRKLLDGRLVI